jgi:hypothetical protein
MEPILVRLQHSLPSCGEGWGGVVPLRTGDATWLDPYREEEPFWSPGRAGNDADMSFKGIKILPVRLRRGGQFHADEQCA